MSEEKKEQINEIIEGCIKGDRKSQQVLYKMFYGKMLGVCMRYSKDKDDALDILQEGFLKVFTNLRSYTSSGSFEGWMRKIMINTSLDSIKKNKFLIQGMDAKYVEASVAETTDEDQNEEYLNISSSEIMKAIQQLSPAYRAVFGMYVVDGFSHREIAEQLGISEGSSKSNLSKARMHLKKILEEIEEGLFGVNIILIVFKHGIENQKKISGLIVIMKIL